MLGKPKLDTSKLLISLKSLIDSYISYDEFASVNKMRGEKKKKKLLQILCNMLYKYGWFNEKNVCKKCCDGILWVNENIDKRLDHKNLRKVTIKDHSNHRKLRYNQ